MKRSIHIIFVLLSGVLVAQGQNLVPNGSFESYTDCPEEYVTHVQENTVHNWTSPNKGTPDYFHSCSYKCGVPLNWVGNADAYEGKAYMGIIACMQQIDPHQIAYREYLRIELPDSLKAGKKYYAAMQVRLGLSCSMACSGIGMFFSASPMNSFETINYPVKAHISKEQVIMDAKNTWTPICGIYEARGDEKYLLIGNFLSNQQMEYKALDENLIPTPHISPMAYYYIDDVIVLPYNDTVNYACDFRESTITEDFRGEIRAQQRMVLKNLYFEIDKATILKESYVELDQLAYELRKKPRLTIAIYGHTDNSGSDEYNDTLSEKRALAVRNYLLEKGISRFRISTKGFGKRQPISENITEEGKQKNRKVEIEVF